MKTTKRDPFTSQDRFNWGFHDAVYDQQKRNGIQLNPKAKRPASYVAGYDAGVVSFQCGLDLNSSLAAWKLHQQGKRADGSPKGWNQ